eukprot:TRINITY_DN78309_c0_g1_i1.p1 TRINITY_DN78309_c0_g1~~TRINITY_DN78309_c0_g1_i1.p1  ORF type:complete len:208 (+),score=41.17 TRINITY_DN78309_c0_g1_i1:65-688(+)
MPGPSPVGKRLRLRQTDDDDALPLSLVFETPATQPVKKPSSFTTSSSTESPPTLVGASFGSGRRCGLGGGCGNGTGDDNLDDDACADYLRDDAPEGHIAHSAVKFLAHKQGHLYTFTYNKEHFQVTVGHACNSYEHAARIARLCYVRFEAGDTKRKVTAYRAKLLRVLCADPSLAEARKKGAVGRPWFKQLGTKHSGLKLLVDPLDC